MTIAAEYSAKYETNALQNGAAYHGDVDYSESMTLAQLAEAGGKITRLRVFREGLRVDVSYIHATLPDGSIVPVVGYPAFSNWFGFKANLVEWAKEQGVFAKGLGLLDESNWSILR